MAFLILAGMLATLFIWAFLKNVYIAILRRMFLEARAYRTAVFTEFYADARGDAKERAIEGSEYLNDEYLFTVASGDELKNAYADIEEHKRFVEAHNIELTPVNAFFAENFSLWLGSAAGTWSRTECLLTEASCMVRGFLYTGAVCQ